MTGQEKCRLLKQIRKEIADKNGIAYEPAECTYKGECQGTCFRCDAEIKYLDAQLNKKAELGGKISVAGFKLDGVEVDYKEQKGFEPLRRNNSRGNNPNIYQTMGLILPPRFDSANDGDESWEDDDSDI